jgi:hypothetical protein
MEYHLKFVDCLDDICVKLLYVLDMQFVREYTSKKMSNLYECIPYPIYR